MTKAETIKVFQKCGKGKQENEGCKIRHTFSLKKVRRLFGSVG